MKVVNQYQNDALSILAQLAISLIITERVNGSLSGWDGVNTRQYRRRALFCGQQRR